jgi:UDPglucose 6-dehydrogenase
LPFIGRKRCDLGTKHTDVCVVGLWHLGCVYAACLAKLGYRVTGIDEDETVVSSLRKGRAPLYEPGLDDLISEEIAAGNMKFESDVKTGVREARFVIIAFDTPLDEHDRVDPSVVWETAKRLKSVIGQSTVVVSCQVPVGTCEEIEKTIWDVGSSPSLAYVPENLRLGQAIDRFMHPDMIVIGANDATVLARVRGLFSPIRTKIIEMNLRSAEMTKHAINCFLATSISYANEIGNICDLVGADGLRVADALRSDSRIGSKALVRPGLGFAGGTLARDLRILQEVGEEYHYETTLIDGVLQVNERQNASIVERLERAVGNMVGKRICIFGLTYKAGTSTLRRSAALEIIGRLTSKGASVHVYDPRVSKAEVPDLLLFDDPYLACKGADAIVIVNDLADFANLDFKKIKSAMKSPFIFDTQNLLDPTLVADKGIRYMGLGRGTKF